MNFNFDQKLEEILNKKFKSKIHSGYDPEDVDLFFDDIISYISKVNEYRKSMDGIVKNYEAKINKLKSDVIEKDKMINTLQSKVDGLVKEGYGNAYLMNRISKIESQVNKNNPNNQKNDEDKK